MSEVKRGWSRPARIEAVIFDVHSTLVDQGSADEWIELALARSGHELSALSRAGLASFLDRVWEGARIADPTSSRDLSFAAHERVFHDLLAAGPAVPRPLAEALYGTLLDTWRAYDDAVPTLTALRAMGQRVCVISNVGLPISSILDRDAITPLVDGTVLSYEVGSVKPDPAIFHAALDILGFPAAQVLMVGDDAHDDGGGAALGMRTLILPRTAGPVHGLAAVPALVAAVNAALG